MNNLLNYQKEAIEKIVDFYNSDIIHARMTISSGLGINKILINAIQQLLLNNEVCKILFLCGTKSQSLDFQKQLISFSNKINIVSYLPDIKNNGIFVTYYQSILTTTTEIDYNFFDLIICQDLAFLDDSYIYPFFNSKYKKKRLSINDESKLTKNDKLIFKYNIQNAMHDGQLHTINEIRFIDEFLFSFLSYLNFKNIIIENKARDLRLDLTATYKNKQYAFEIKNYRTKYISSDLIENACNRFFTIIKKTNEYKAIMIITSIVDQKIKNKMLENYDVEIWDISNLIYLSHESSEYTSKLNSFISYSITDIKSQPTINFTLEELNENITSKPKYKLFEKELANCSPGKNDNEDKKYEKICTDIIKYLFSTEFFQMSTQHRTNDDLFKMDMICSLKGTTEFWKFLINFYNTKFVVFEYKNYSNELSQNLIFVTSKYLFPEALRNVAFIISRFGVNDNAKMIINSKIKSEKKLIISLTDQDLLIMVAMKENGEDPSDYLLEKVENLLMSLSIY